MNCYWDWVIMKAKRPYDIPGVSYRKIVLVLWGGGWCRGLHDGEIMRPVLIDVP
jgi:hypothetical protein